MISAHHLLQLLGLNIALWIVLPLQLLMIGGGVFEYGSGYVHFIAKKCFTGKVNEPDKCAAKVSDDWALPAAVIAALATIEGDVVYFIFRHQGPVIAVVLIASILLIAIAWRAFTKTLRLAREQEAKAAVTAAPN